MPPSDALAALKVRLQEIEDLGGAAALLGWDQSVYMPPGGAAARGRQTALLARLAHERMVDPALAGLLDELAPWAAGLDPASDDAALVRVTRRDVDVATRLPSAFVQELSEHTAATYDAWERARPANDFAAVRPFLEKTVALSRSFADAYAGFRPTYRHRFDPLVDLAEDGMTIASVATLFDALRAGLVPLLDAIRGRPAGDARCLSGDFAEDRQRAFGEDVIRAFGYDFRRGRQDKTAHPFMTKIGRGDVRITTRYQADHLSDGLFSTLHEAGHAMYEQGIDDALEGTPLFGGATSGVHESQSRLWENLVGRSAPFWERYFPALQASFPDWLGAVDVETFYRAINVVSPSLIRTEADEVTYNFHIMLRFDLELALLDGSLSVADLPGAWRERMRSDLGVEPTDDRDGVLQDVHWFGGLVGGQFQSYTLGNVMSAQFFQAADRAIGGADARIATGSFGELRGWLTENVYRHGRKFTAPELVRRACGQDLSIEPYLTYLRGKFGALYGL